MKYVLCQAHSYGFFMIFLSEEDGVIIFCEICQSLLMQFYLDGKDYISTLAFL